ncbi:MAG TPA: GNAT family N-acetyltransferase [Actinomycetes bacterium]|nr:GNAT family N-acetyltransferase [Actinomycetes bacterium]
MARELVTERLILRPWRLEDAEQALDVYGDGRVARWLDPAMDRVSDLAGMRLVLQQWMGEDERLVLPAGRWAIELKDGHRVIGGAILLPLPPGDEDLEMGWQLRPEAWGHGYATEAGLALARWAFTNGSDELFAVARSANERAVATARRIGLEWVGETDKYYDMHLQVFRLRRGDFES